jgi:MFS family permease
MTADPKAQSDLRVTDPKLGPRYWKLWTASVVSNLGDGIALIAYPWLASAVTRSGFLLALIAVAQRLPWLLFTLPAGVITDRVDRRKIMVAMDAVRTVITLGVAASVLVKQDALPAPDVIADGLAVTGDMSLYIILVIAAFLFGSAEVLRDNAAQTIMPAIVAPENLEKANSRLWGIEMVANSFAGPPLGSMLIAVMFALPFLVDAGTFAVAAGLVFMISGNFRTSGEEKPSGRIDWMGEIKEGVGWLWQHSLLRPMAIILGLMNGLMMMTFATFVLFAQEILHTSAFTFAVLGTGAAVGGLLATFLAPRVSQRLGSGPSLFMTIVAGSLTSLITGFASSWVLVWAMFVVGVFTAVLWNVVTVALRQTIIPDHLLGRVNSVYRFFAWGMMPVGSIVGGLVVAITELVGSRDLALRMPWFAVAAAYALVLIYAAPRLTTAKIEEARAEGIKAKKG